MLRTADGLDARPEAQGAGATFFGIGKGIDISDWRGLRNRWEYSHVARAVVTSAGFTLLAGVVALE